jgi:hypothetical protein
MVKKTRAIGATSDYGTRFNILKGRVIRENHDPWLPLCEHCILPDCIRNGGEMTPLHRDRRWPGCIIWEVAMKGVTAREVLDIWEG